MGSTYQEGFAVTQATQQLHFPVLPSLVEEAAMSGDRDPSRLRGRGLDVLMIDGEPWFASRDVGAILGLINVRQSVAYLDDDERGVTTADTPGGQQEVSVVSEAGLYSLIMRSRVPAAGVFKRWVTHDVLPAIRKTGRYVEPTAPKTRVELARELLAAEEAREEAEREVAEQRRLLVRAHAMLTEVEPKVEAYDALQATDHDWSMRDAAAILNRDPEIWKRFRLGQNGLFRLLREFRMVDNANHVYASHKQHLRLLPMTYSHPHTGEPRASEQLRLTAGGLVYLQKRLGGTSPDALHLDEPNEPMPV